MPLTDGVGAALVSAAPDRLRMRVDSAGGAAILRPLVVPPLYVAADVVPPLQAPVTRAASCRGAREVEDVPRIVEEATREAGLSGSDVTSVRMLWCRREGARGEAALALGARQGPDIQCYQLDETAPDDSYETARQCWPVPRGAGTSTPFLAPALPVPGSQGNDLPVTVHAPGAAFAELQAAPAGSPTVARARVDPDGYGRFVATGMPAAPRDVLAREGAITLLDRSRRMISILLVSRQHPSDVWGEAANGSVGSPDALLRPRPASRSRARPRLARVTTSQNSGSPGSSDTLRSGPDIKPRSRDVTDGLERAAARGMLRAVGMTDDDWDKPQIGVASSWNEITPCNLSLDRLAQASKEGVHAGGGYPLRVRHHLGERRHLDGPRGDALLPGQPRGHRRQRRDRHDGRAPRRLGAPRRLRQVPARHAHGRRAARPGQRLPLRRLDHAGHREAVRRQREARSRSSTRSRRWARAPAA